MSYLMRKLILSELNLRNTFRIINKYTAGFDEGEVNLPNFSHWNMPNETSIRLRMNYRDNEAKQKGDRLLNQLVDDNDIIEYLPEDDWENKDDASSINKKACFLAFQTASRICNEREFENINQGNLILINFPICFFNRFFDEFDIDLNFTIVDVRTYCITPVQNLINPALDSISNIVFNREDFINFNFFERFIHMVCNNLLISGASELLFWNLLYNRNTQHSESREQTFHRFCEELRNH